MSRENMSHYQTVQLHPHISLYHFPSSGLWSVSAHCAVFSGGGFFPSEHVTHSWLPASCSAQAMSQCQFYSGMLIYRGSPLISRYWGQIENPVRSDLNLNTCHFIHFISSPVEAQLTNTRCFLYCLTLFSPPSLYPFLMPPPPSFYTSHFLFFQCFVPVIVPLLYLQCSYTVFHPSFD